MQVFPALFILSHILFSHKLHLLTGVVALCVCACACVRVCVCVCVCVRVRLQQVLDRVSRMTQGDLVMSMDQLLTKPRLGTCHKFYMQPFTLSNSESQSRFTGISSQYWSPSTAVDAS